MPRAEKPKARRPVAATNPNTSTIYARAPAVVCAGAGLPSRWRLQAGAQQWCVPRRCAIRLVS